MSDASGTGSIGPSGLQFSTGIKYPVVELKPVAIIVVSRQTAQEEAAQITVNAFSIEDLYAAVTAAGEALRKRTEDNNLRLLTIRDPIPAMNAPGGRA